mmetsp:Transcript_31647/g.48407  ORF Transcript_31647/g.48407 Transcript_31647/m.48407 type:complete len:121 (-) Transcript_31647:64-426(-)
MHDKEMGTQGTKFGILHSGYPDTGCGWYSRNLPYADWMKMQFGQRIQIAYLEQFVVTVMALWATYFKFPMTATYIGLAYLVGRILYSIGYSMSPQKRSLGAWIVDLAVMGLAVMGIISGV